MGKTMEVYVDNMLVKLRLSINHVKDLGTMFNILRQHRMNLNLLKYHFGVAFEKFLRFIANARELKPILRKSRRFEI